MCWASNRTTTRVEDLAYSLMGLFDVNMPLLYNEGMKAFIRLQEEIVRKFDDETIFLWSDPDGHDVSYRGIFARHPRNFSKCRDIVQKPDLPTKPLPFALTNSGLRMSVKLFAAAWAPLDEQVRKSLRPLTDLYIPVLHCGLRNQWDSDHTQSVILRRIRQQDESNRPNCYTRALSRLTVPLKSFESMHRNERLKVSRNNRAIEQEVLYIKPSA